MVVVECYCFLMNIIVVCVGARRRGPARTDCVFNSNFFLTVTRFGLTLESVLVVVVPFSFAPVVEIIFHASLV